MKSLSQSVVSLVHETGGVNMATYLNGAAVEEAAEGIMSTKEPNVFRGAHACYGSEKVLSTTVQCFAHLCDEAIPAPIMKFIAKESASAGALSDVKVRVRVGGSVLGKKHLNAWTYQELQPMTATEEEEQGGEKKGEKKKGEKKKGRGKGKKTLAREEAELERKGEEEREAKKLKTGQESV